MERKTHTIDATNKVLGRLATEITILLRGKHKPSYLPYKDEGDFVIVKNVSKLRVTGKKADKKIYFRHSGYMGGEKLIPFKKLFEKDPAKVLRLAVLRMLPRNRLKAKQIRRLKIEK